MANGDVTIKTLYRQSLGGGRDASGTPQNSKILVIGEITGDYVSTGLAINKLGGPAAFGVNNLDYVYLNLISVAGVFPTAEKLGLANFDVVNNKIFVVDDMGEADPAKPDDGQAVVLRFIALGDDATVPELG
jgi:hypothetical protein